ncbi:MAG: hypothetical protein ABJM39_11705 [Porticoccus sp.]|uniref:hypothetical protein n=1 Tax=Pseudomonadati TaxID=3379134 RepID=UPI0032673519
MHNHDHKEFASGKDVAEFVTGVFHLAVSILGVFWALCIKKRGTVGTRVYMVDTGLCWLGLLAMTGQPGDWMFHLALVVLPLLWLYHLVATWSRKEHVHTMCIGSSPFPFEASTNQSIETFLGIGLGVLIATTLDFYFGCFLALSAFAGIVRAWMIDERDRRRAVQMNDALAEQEYMMRTMEKYSK